MAVTIARCPRVSALRALLTSEAGVGLVLMGAAALARLVTNSGLASAYFGLLGAYVGPLAPSAFCIGSTVA